MVTGVFAVVVLSDSVGAVGAVDCRSCRSCRSAVGVLSDFAVVLSYRGSILVIAGNGPYPWAFLRE